MTVTPRVTITFHGKPVGSKERPRQHNIRRTITVPSPFTYKQAREAAFKAVQEPELNTDSPAYVVKQPGNVTNIAFN